MKYQEQCDSCGHIITAFTHVINAQLVIALRQLYDFYTLKKKPCNLQKHLNLTKNQYNNFQKLQYFGLVIRDQGGWVPTMKGEMFLYGEMPILKRVITFGKEVLSETHELYRKIGSTNQLLFVHEINKEAWKKRVEYQQEKSATLFD